MPDVAASPVAAPAPVAAGGAPDLPAWAGGQGSAPQQPTPAAPAAQPQGSWSNIAEAIPSGLYSGIAKVPNIPTDVINAASGAMKGLTGQDYGTLTPPVNTNPTGYTPHDAWAKGLHDASEAASNMAAMGGAARMITPLLPAGSAPAIASEAMEHTPPGMIAASAAGGAAEEPIAKNVPEEYQPLARFAGNVATGGLVGGAENAIKGGIGGSVSPEAARLAQLGRDTYDIPIRGGQISGNRLMRTADSALKSIPLSGHGALDEEAQGAFNAAVSRTIGENSTKITPQVMTAARARIGNVLQDVENRNPVSFDPPFMNDLSSIESSARSSLTDPEFAVIRRQMDGVLSNVQPNNQVSGQTYGNLMHKGAPLDAAANSANPNIANFAGDIRNALRDSLQRSLSGPDLDAYQTARTQWKNMRTIEPLTTRADIVGGASPSTGDIIPGQLRAVVNRSYNNSAFASPGQIPLNDLANIGQRFLKELPSSQTSERTNFMHMLERAGGLFGAVVTGQHFGISPPEQAAAAGATLGLARGASAALRSDAYANRMIQKGLGNAPQNSSVGVPLVTSAGVRQLEPPQDNQSAPSVNPKTGLQEFSLKAANPSKRTATDGIAAKVFDGTLSNPKDLQAYIDQNKQPLRSVLGGQGLQNIMFAAAVTRRPGNVFSILSGGQEPSPALSQAFDAAGVKDIPSLISLAMANQPIAKILATKTTRPTLSRPGEAQLINAIQQSMQDNANGDGNPRRARNGVGPPATTGQGGNLSANAG